MKIKNRFKFKNWKRYLFEFLSVFLAVIFAFLLDKSNERRKNGITENKILEEIYNGLERDSLDLADDERSYKIAFRGLKYFSKIIDGENVQNDSLADFYFYFSREFLVVQNKSGYESLKSRGLETIKKDSLRSSIIDLYEVDYEKSRKFNEEYREYKFMDNYFHKINEVLAPNFEYDETNNIKGIKLPIDINEKERSLIKSYLWKIADGKQDLYQGAKYDKEKIGKLRTDIKKYLDNKSK